MNDFDYKKDSEYDGGGDEVYSRVVRAGRRTYFFDVKATKANDYYLTVTESRKKRNRNGDFSYEKHKLFLYKEDFAKFMEGFNDVMDYVKTEKADFFAKEDKIEEDIKENEYSEMITHTVSEEEFDNL